MASFITAAAIFVVIASIISALRTGDDEAAAAFADSPRKLPNPGPRDIYAVGGTLGSAPVPSWG
jgi:hypothetical protein